MIVIVNYGMGNLGSIKNMLRKVGVDSSITSDKDEILKAEKLILPGVGAFDTGITNLKELGLIDVLNQKVKVEKTPILGVCLGVQLMTMGSEEGNLPGLGWFDAYTEKFKFESLDKKLPLPNMGWLKVTSAKKTPLFENMHEDPKFYFVHTYHLKANQKEDISMKSEYGYQYTVGLEKEKIMGVQFHPEKSHKFGIRLYENFVKI